MSEEIIRRAQEAPAEAIAERMGMFDQWLWARYSIARETLERWDEETQVGIYREWIRTTRLAGEASRYIDPSRVVVPEQGWSPPVFNEFLRPDPESADVALPGKTSCACPLKR